MEQPVDVIIPAYNAAEWVGTAIESCLQPEVGRVIVVDDCSPDDGVTWQAIQTCASRNDRVLGIRLEGNGGQYVASNVALNYLREDCKFIGFQDADDIAEPERWKKTLAAFEAQPELDIVSGRDESINSDGSDHKPMQGRECRYENPDNPNDILDRRYGHVLTHGAMTIRRAVITALAGFEPSYGGSDTQFIVRAHFAGFRMKNLNTIMLRRRLHDNQATHNSSKDPTRNAYRQKQASEYIWWNMLKRQGRLKPHHLKIAPAQIPVADCTCEKEKI